MRKSFWISSAISPWDQHLISQGFAANQSAREFRVHDPLGLIDAWVKADTFAHRATTTRYTAFGGSPLKLMPALTLDYFLPGEVDGDDSFTDYVEPPVPSNLGVRVQNTGYGYARKLKIDSGQPKIVENEQGLFIDFKILGSEVNGAAASASLLADFGDIAPNRSGVGRWIMASTLSGRFVEFTATYTHADDLGGQLTTLFTGTPRTHTLIRDVLVDLPGRDGVRDFLAKDTDVIRVYESDTVDTAVPDLSAGSTITGAGNFYTVNSPAGVGFRYIKLGDPQSGRKVVKKATRGDGKWLPLANAWCSQTQDRTTHNGIISLTYST